MHIRVIELPAPGPFQADAEIEYIDTAKIPIFAFSKAVHKIFSRAILS
jgi:hypothetical protein